LKTKELSLLIGINKEFDFVNPQFEVLRVDSHEIRQNILIISYSDWKKLGFSKGTLHYISKNSKVIGLSPLTVTKKINLF